VLFVTVAAAPGPLRVHRPRRGPLAAPNPHGGSCCGRWWSAAARWRPLRIQWWR